ncbi:MAG: hypothetical protein Tsb0034_25710 [Ekhidna sp.]
MAEKSKIILPDKYYLDYFHYVLDFVEKHYDHILDQPEHLFYQAFRDLSEDAQCLYIRFSNRKGTFFRINKLKYPEIQEVESSVEELERQGFIRINESEETDQFKLYTKAELLSFFPFLNKNQKKEEMLFELSEEDISGLHAREQVAELLKTDEVDFIKLLFFGNRYGQMTDFVIRDVGNVKLEKLDESHFKPWFQSRDEALGVMHLSQLRRMVREMIEAGMDLQEVVDELPWQHWLSFPRSKRYAERLILELGEHFERNQNWEESLQLYSLTKKYPARERKIRILEKTGSSDEAAQLAQMIVSRPENAAELTFATDYLNRSGVRINRSMTERLKKSPIITLNPNKEINVEQLALEHLQEDGWEGVHAENYLWRSMFGLIFWEEIFDERHGAFHHPLQRQPSDLNDHSFFESRETLLVERLDQLDKKERLWEKVAYTHRKKEGLASRFVTWHEALLPVSEVMIDRLPLEGLKKVMLEVAKNVKTNSTGFPDLFLWKEADYQFYEVKSPNDQLSAQQLFWLNFFQTANINAEVLRISYTD